MKGKMAGERNPMFGVRLTGEQNPMFGKHHTEETKQKIREKKEGVEAWNKGKPST